MKKIFLISTFLVLAYFVNAQTLKIQAGISSSSIDWKIVNGTAKIYNQKIIGHSIFIGLDYLQKKYFNFSSNIGIIRKGGSDNNIFFTDPFGQPLISEKQRATLDYLAVNTTLDLTYPIKEKLFPFVSLAPRLDYLISSSSHFSYLKDMNELNRLSYGLNIGAGIKYQFFKFQIGIKGDYLFNLSNIADYKATNGIQFERIKVKDKTFLLNVVCGFNLK